MSATSDVARGVREALSGSAFGENVTVDGDRVIITTPTRMCALSPDVDEWIVTWTVAGADPTDPGVVAYTGLKTPAFPIAQLVARPEVVAEYLLELAARTL